VVKVDWDLVRTAISAGAFVLAGASFWMAQTASSRSRKSEDVKALLGDRESVAFASLKLLREGVPNSRSDRETVIHAVVQACVFESSNRARALLYRVIAENCTRYPTSIDDAVRSVERTFSDVALYELGKDHIDVRHGLARLDAVKKVISRARSQHV
jgi:hypothetical protein